MQSRILYRPVGLFELRLIRDSDYAAFPPRLPEQPIFYPVLHMDYAIQIARDWNTKDAKSGYMGAVTRFELPIDYLSQFEERTVGSTLHRELWIPAEELANFNQQLLSSIEVLTVFYGDAYVGDQEW